MAPARRHALARRSIRARLVAVGIVLLALAVGLGLAFAGSPDRLASGTRIAGIDVGGLTQAQARRLLEGRARRLADVPVVLTAGSKRFRVTPRQLGVHVDWAAAVASAQRQGAGFGFVRGYRRLELEFFREDVVPMPTAYDAAVEYEVGRIANAVDRGHREARLVRRGLHVTIAAGSTGSLLDRPLARRELLDALASFARVPVALPVSIDPPTVGVAALAPLQRLASLVISRPVTAVVGPTRYRIPRWRLAQMLALPATPAQPLALRGAAADRYFGRLERTVDRQPVDASWAASASGAVRVVPAKAGVALDVTRSAALVLAAAERPSNRVAQLVSRPVAAARSTAQAASMGITGTVGTYETVYGGDPNRIHNVQLVAHLVDGKLIAPGATFSFNGTTGERTAAKGFLEAPVIVDGELQTGLGGGVCQVSTTVFNAAFEAGLPITARTNHSLYISHYPLGRDATVNYPDTDLRFVNDTPHWLLLRTYVGAYSLRVALYGTPQHRRVVSVASPLVVDAPPPVEKTVDATLAPGSVVVDDYGAPAQSTSVERKVYSASGTLLSDQTWYSSYRSQPKIVRVGPPRKQAHAKTPTTSTTSTTTAATATTTAPTTTAVTTTAVTTTAAPH